MHRGCVSDTSRSTWTFMSFTVFKDMKFRVLEWLVSRHFINRATGVGLAGRWIEPSITRAVIWTSHHLTEETSVELRVNAKQMMLMIDHWMKARWEGSGDTRR